MTLYQTIKKSFPDAEVYHEGCQRNYEWDTGEMCCLDHQVDICAYCYRELKEGEFGYCSQDYR